MSNVFTLDSLNDELEKKYAPFEFQAGRDKFTLRQVLRLTKAERALVSEKLESIDENTEVTEDEAQEMLEFVLKTVTDNGKGEKLVAVLDHDLLKIKMLFDKWVTWTQPGEA